MLNIINLRPDSDFRYFLGLSIFIIIFIIAYYRTRTRKSPQKWKCKRCKSIVDMKKFKCNCSISPSPWEPVE